MLINLMKLKKHLKGDEFVMKTFQKAHTPLRYSYRGIYECIGYATVWNDWGGIENEFKMYRPLNKGTILYDVEGL